MKTSYVCSLSSLTLAALVTTPCVLAQIGLGGRGALNVTLVKTSAKSLPLELDGATPLQWSVRMADSEMARLGNKLAFKPGGGGKWDYTAGLFTLSLLKLNEQVKDPRYVHFAEEAIGSFITPDGNIQGYKVAEYQLDALNPGKTALALWQLTKDERYWKCASLLRKQLDTQPRTGDGGFWHKQRYPHQMWLDGLYMGAPFYAEYTKLHGGPAADFDDVAKQFKLVQQHLYDPPSGLFYHGWDESKEQSWANKATGTSSNFWGRAIGWYGMALVDVLDYMPPDHPARPELLSDLQQLAAGVVKHQDPASGLWYQVMDQGSREGNYLEATASSMFVYTLAKGINRGYLTPGRASVPASPDFLAATLKAYQGLLKKLVHIETNGQVSLTHCCSVAGLGSYGHPRDGSFKYYISEPVVDNDLKGVGPFVLAGLEMQRLIEPSWISLFSGKDLTGWVSMNEGVFVATNGNLGLVGGKGWLRSEKQYTNFVFEAEWRGLATDYNSGLFLRAALEGNPFPTEAWQVNLKQSTIGELLRGSKNVVRSVTPAIPANQWVTFRMEARGRNLTLFVNGERVWDFDQLEPAFGYLGLQAEGRAFEFRNLRIRESQ